MFYEEVWGVPHNELTLANDVVHVWYVPLNQPMAAVQRFTHLLAPDELQRAERFHFARDRYHYIVSRGVLRTLLGRYLQCAPEQLQFQYGERGKPTLSHTKQPKQLQFNLSHTHERAIYAFAWERELGIDIEYIRTLDDMESIANHFFSAREYQQLCALPQADKQRAFFTCWTRKEAYIKARGDGLAYPLDQFAVSFAPEDCTPLLEVYGDTQETERWSLHGLPTEADYVAALIVEGHTWELRCWRWPDNALF
ncbi:MAG: 4*-phosphopantetheinyl transferase superfamily protein [Chloroflexi bacterium AL-W]|nr:4*-phosphopantetheinyl transferase superfamily protein [Chloroflexi bacterium AL-N1]NOK71322.1 4*-phosphopantetheinyl transferase superfamily protein [Chloroflexi bacterium AL-N10]NOK78668.1 4*-phosphopantetheinyl transferase superfamily protein [Chloroflexi bacterium AL-N5]NOK85964.1 4*-phosphopantetheinyl transferase superfamily protein [Chloroflexi bacterium AL-W]NOK93047.1 4*-phosphopantetheinyl transferase superfamily protein [Chloroflexi bacterium AL-N15]